MNTAEIKFDLLKKIEALNPRQLKEAYGFFQNYLNSNAEEWNNVSPELQQKIDQGLKEADNDQLVSLKEATSKIRSKYGLHG